MYSFNNGMLMDGSGDPDVPLTVDINTLLDPDIVAAAADDKITDWLTEEEIAAANAWEAQMSVFDAAAAEIEAYEALIESGAWSDLSAAERTATRASAYQAQRTLAQGIKPEPPPPDANYIYEYVWRTSVGSTSTNYSGEWVLVRFPNFGGIGATGNTSFSFNGLIAAPPKGSTNPTNPTQPGTGVNPQPPQPPPPPPPPPQPVKTAPIDTILFESDDTLPQQIMSDLIFENIGGQELIDIARNDTVNGQEVIYQPIKNLTQINQQYNPNNILKLQNTSDKYFQNFPLKFESRVPNIGSGPEGAHIYIDDETGDLIIEAINVGADEEVLASIVSAGSLYESTEDQNYWILNINQIDSQYLFETWNIFRNNDGSTYWIGTIKTVGYQQNFAAIIKISTDGDIEWSKKIAPIELPEEFYFYPLSLTTDSSENIIMLFAYNNPSEYIATRRYILKFTKDGTLLWKKIFNIDPVENWANFHTSVMRCDINDNLYFNCTMLSDDYQTTYEMFLKSDSDGNIIDIKYLMDDGINCPTDPDITCMAKTFNIPYSSSDVDSNGNFYACYGLALNYYQSIPFEEPSTIYFLNGTIALSKYDNSNSLVWYKRIECPPIEYSPNPSVVEYRAETWTTGVKLSNDGNYLFIAAGTFMQPDYEGFATVLLKVNTNDGSIVWQKAIQGELFLDLNGVTDNCIYLSGTYPDWTANGNLGFVKLDLDGNLIYAMDIRPRDESILYSYLAADNNSVSYAYDPTLIENMSSTIITNLKPDLSMTGSYTIPGFDGNPFTYEQNFSVTVEPTSIFTATDSTISENPAIGTTITIEDDSPSLVEEPSILVQAVKKDVG